MSLSADETLVRKFLTETRLEPAMPSGGLVIPSPVFFAGREDYWNTVGGVSYTTQPTMEKAHVFFCCLQFRSMVDIEGAPHSPLFGFQYDIEVFSEYDPERADETVTPDDFNKRTLLRHNEFVACCLGIKEAFQGNLDMGLALSEPYVTQRTTPVTVTEEVQNRARTEFVPGIVGWKMKFRETVQLRLEAC